MNVQFRRTGERRYAVTILRENQTPLEMNPAPGFDPIMPHDLLHFIVESELGLQQGIYGQIASGGTAGTFHPLPAVNQQSRATARLRRRVAKRGEKLQRAGQQEAVLAEQATQLCLHEWLSRSPQAEKNRSVRMPAPTLPPTLSLSAQQIQRICARMDELSAQWSSLKVGESLTIRWRDTP